MRCHSRPKGEEDMKKPRILIADDHPMVLTALRDLLEAHGDVVGTVTDGQALVKAAQRLRPDVIFSDISMPKLNGLDAIRALKICAPQSRVIIVTTYQESVYMTLAFNAGAHGLLLKRSTLAAELPQALLHVLAGDRFIGLGVREENAYADEAEVRTWRSAS
jgi:DNA-binding NarL/FixJ family response regulator